MCVTQTALEAATVGANAWAWGWEAAAAIATALTFLLALLIYATEVVGSRLAAARRRCILASGLLHAVTLTRNYLAVASSVLPGVLANHDPKGLARALLLHHGSDLREHLPHIAELGNKTGCDFAYAVSLIASIDKFATWLSEDGTWPMNAEQQRQLQFDLDFFAESAAQAKQSLDSVEAALKESIPAHIRKRRFGESARWLSVRTLSRNSRVESVRGDGAH